MKIINVTKNAPLKGEISPPPDKSISHRAVILASIANGKSIIKNFLCAEDPMRTVEAFKQMGIEIREFKGSRVQEFKGTKKFKNSKVQEFKGSVDIAIKGKGLTGLKKPREIIDCGNSGTTMRLLCGVLAGQQFSSALTGDASLRSRPMKRVIIPLAKMGARITSSGRGYPPLTIQGGNLKPIRYKSPVASAQVKSAILLAGLYCSGITTVSEPDKSRDHTERMLKASGADINVKNLEVSIRGGVNLKPLDTTIPGDFSSAAFFIVAGAVVPGSGILVRDVGINPTRTGLLEILKMMGAHIKIENKHEVSGEPVADLYASHSALKGVIIGSALVLRAIDEFPIICIAAALAQGTTKITGARELRVKESD
ncbi:MAG: 3-phosphoshikimate 1-carboxyvinyltransferase, partial [Nitrospirae bacterium]|nr:3-phosphoshikimate 1-carboxyvinyltransferase [Nitrospirota bacterium]